MPDLPTLTVTQTQADRMLAAWGSIANYKEWLKNQIIQYVVTVESKNARQDFETTLTAQIEQLQNELQ